MQVNGIGLRERILSNGLDSSEEVQAGREQVLTEGIKESVSIKENRPAAIHLNVDKTAEEVGLYEGESLKEDETSAMIEQIKQQLNFLANQMTGMDYQELKGLGYDLKTDETGKIETVMDQIQVKLTAFCKNYDAGMNIDKEDLEAVLGSSALAAAAANKLSEYNLPVTDDNIKEVVDGVERASSLKPVTKEHTAYLIENDMSPTYENIYKAQHSTGISKKQLSPISDQDFQDLSGQVEDVMKKAGVKVTEESLKEAKWMIEQGIPFEPESVKLMQEYKSISLEGKTEEKLDQIVQAMAWGKGAGGASPQDQILTPEMAQRAVDEVNERIDREIDALERVSEEERKTAVEQWSDGKSNSLEEIDIQQLKARRQLEELRLMMTREAALELMDKGIDIQTEPLENLVDQLKQRERQYYQEMYQAEGFELTEEKLDLLHQTGQEVKALGGVPSYVIGEMEQAQMESELPLTVHHTYERGTTLKSRLDAAQESYEALMTKPDSNYGDNISKAFQNMDSLLDEINVEKTEENRRAVRILAYNQMPIEEEQLEKVKDLDREYQYFMKNLTPRTAMYLIEEQINPLDLEIHELNNILEHLNENLGISKEERYSEYLWKLEKQQKISEEEREAYIGLYRLAKNVSRTDGAAIGALVNQDREVTLQNLLTAARSGKTKGMDVSIDQAYGMAENVFQQNSITEQLKLFYQPDYKGGQGENHSESDYQRELGKKMKELSSDTQAMRLIAESGQPVTMENLMAAGVMSGHRGGGLKKLWESRKKEDTQDSVVDSLTDDESMQEVYEQVEEGFNDHLDEMLFTQTPTYEELEECRLFYRTASLMRSLAQQEDYQIPMELGNETTLVHVKFVRGDRGAGKVSVEMEVPDKGKISAEFHLNGEQMTGYLLGDSAKLAKELSVLSSEIQKKFKDLGVMGSISCSNAKEIPTVGYKKPNETKEKNPAQTKTLYGMAKAFLEIIKAHV